MIDEKNISRELIEKEKDVLQKVCELLRGHELMFQKNLIDICAAICNVESENLLTDVSSLNISQTRWFYWYVCRFIYNDTYRNIARKTQEMSNKSYTLQGVCVCVKKMSWMIDSQMIWRKRWNMIRYIIKQQSEQVGGENFD